MSIFDTILVVILSFFVFYGFFFGFFRVVGSLFGIVIGSFIASRYYLGFYEWIDWAFGGYENLGKVASFIILFSIINRLTSLAFFILDKAFSIFSILPFAKLTNRIAGAVLSFIEGILILGLFIYVSARYSIVGEIFGDMLVESQIAPLLLKVNKILLPLLPEVLKAIKSLI